MPTFEWDTEKAQSNLAKHGVGFELASRAFEDRRAIEWLDERFDYDEERSIILGMVEGALIFVVFSERDEEVVRIISARHATRQEEDEYARQEN